MLYEYSIIRKGMTSRIMAEETRNGIISENGKKIYYENGIPTHAGVIKVDGDIYYAGHNGVIVTDEKKIVHRSMANDLLEHGTYRFDEEGKLVEGYYHAPTSKRKSSKKHRHKHHRKLKSILKIALPIAAVLVAGLVIYFGWFYDTRTPDIESASPKESSQRLIELPEYTDDVYLCSKSLKSYYNGSISLKNAISLTDGEAYAPFEFRYRLSGDAKANLELDGKSYDLEPGDSYVRIDNLMTGEEYTYTVTATKGEEKETYEGKFTTAPTNRFVYLPGLKNTRDIGGYQTSFGKKVRQGMLIRGTEPDGMVVGDYYLTDPSYAKDFNFRYDFDLREKGLYSTTYVEKLGENVSHKLYSSPCYGNIFSDSNLSTMKEIFTDLADKEHYPMYMHCTHGADRAGTIVFLLQGLLGVSEEDMKFEYELTGFTYPRYAGGKELNGIYGGLEGIAGKNINEKIENYLINQVGLTKVQINTIRDIFLED